MPHVTFIHGICNKPPKDQLLKDWMAALAQGGLDLEQRGVSTSMVYWADVMYAAPEGGGAKKKSPDGPSGRDSRAFRKISRRHPSPPMRLPVGRGGDLAPDSPS